MTDPIHYHALSQAPYKCTVSADDSRKPIKCPHCGHALFDGQVFRVRILKIFKDGCIGAKCHCKSWRVLPLRYDNTGHRYSA